MASALGDPPASGVNMPAEATGASASRATPAAASARASGRRRKAFGRSCKAAGSYPALARTNHFVAMVASVGACESKSSARLAESWSRRVLRIEEAHEGIDRRIGFCGL